MPTTKKYLIKNALSKEIRTALIVKYLPQIWAECISKLLTNSGEIIAINNQFRPQAASIANSPKPPDPSSMDWEPTKSTTTGTKEVEVRRAIWVKKETLAYKKKNKLCVRCSHRGHIATNCGFLAPLKNSMFLQLLIKSESLEKKNGRPHSEQDMACLNGKFASLVSQEHLLHSRGI